MPFTAFRSPGTLASLIAREPSFTVTWSNPSNAGSSNNSDATAAIANSTSRALQGTNFGFVAGTHYPAGATIIGANCRVECKRDSSLTSGNYSMLMYLVATGPVYGTGQVALSNSTLVGTSDTLVDFYATMTDWGLTSPDVTHTDFGMNFHIGSSNTGTFYVDHIQMQLEYAVPRSQGVIIF